MKGVATPFAAARRFSAGTTHAALRHNHEF
jgi:hypothetical protein